MESRVTVAELGRNRAVAKQAPVVLLISLYPTHPPIAGRMVRLLHLARAIRQIGYRPILVYQDFVRADSRALKDFWGADLHLVPYRAHEVTWCLRRLMRKVLDPRCRAYRWALRLHRQRFEQEQFRVGLDELYDPALAAHIRRLCQREKPQACICLDVFMSRCFEAVPDTVLRILDTNDLYAVGRQDERSSRNLWVELSLEEELRGLRRADLVWTIQGRDEAKLREVAPDLRVLTVGHPVDLVTPDLELSLRSKKILFVGSKHKWNLQGLRWFSAEVYPLLRGCVPERDIVIAGDVCDLLGHELPFTCLGRVPQLEALYRAARVVICPILGGGGLKLKSIEPMGYGKALVCTRPAAAGLEAAEGRAFLVGETAAGFAESIISVARDDALCAHLMQGAFTFAQEWNREVLAQLRLSLQMSKTDSLVASASSSGRTLNHVQPT